MFKKLILIKFIFVMSLMVMFSTYAQDVEEIQVSGKSIKILLKNQSVETDHGFLEVDSSKKFEMAQDCFDENRLAFVSDIDTYYGRKSAERMYSFHYRLADPGFPEILVFSFTALLKQS